MDKVNSIKFQLLYKVNPQQIVCISFHNCPQYQYLPQRMICNQQKHDHTWTLQLIFSDSIFHIKTTDRISYSYYVAPYDNQKIKLRDVLDQKTLLPMQLSFLRSDYLDSYVEFFDRCDFQINNSRKEKYLKLDQVMSFNMKLITSSSQRIPQGRSLFVFTPSDLLKFNPQQLDLDDKRSNQQKNNLFKAQRMEKHELPNHEQLWIFRYVTNLATLKKINGFMVFAIFQSYCYDRKVKTWKIKPNPALPSNLPSKFEDIEQLSNLLQSLGVKYQITKITSQNEEENILLTNSNENDFPRETEFVYEVCDDDVNVREIFSVMLIIKGKGRFRMTAGGDKRKWYCSVALYQKQRYGMEYYFEVNIINLTDHSRYSLKTAPQIITSTRNNTNIQVYSRNKIYQRDTFNPVYFPTSSSSSATTYVSAHAQPIKSTFRYLPTHHYHHTSYTNRIRRFKGFCPSSFFTSSRRQGFSAVTTSRQKKSLFTTRTSTTTSTTSSSSTTTTTTSSRPVFYPSLITNTSAGASSQIILNQAHSNNIFKQISAKDNHSVTDYINTINNLTILNSQLDYMSQKLKTANSIDISTPQGKKWVKRTNFTQEFAPISIQLIQETRIQRIEDKFQKMISKVTQKKAQYCDLMTKIHQLQNNQETASNQITQSTIQILFCNIIWDSKEWGKSNFTNFQRIVDRLRQYLPLPDNSNIFSQADKIRISNILYYLNYHCHSTRKYTYKVQHAFHDDLQKRNCQNQIQDKVDAHLSIIRSGRQRPFQFVKDDKLYKILIIIVDSDIKQFVKFGRQHKLQINTDEISENLMRLLMNYAIIYSLGFYYDNRMPIFNVCGCGEFKPFCFETDQTKRFYSHHLDKIRNKYIEHLTNNQITEKTSKQKLVELQQQFTQKIEKDAGKEAIGVFAIQCDVKKIQEYMFKNKKKQVICDIELNQSYTKKLKEIDECQNQEDKFIKVKNWKNDTYFKSFTSFN